MAYICYKCGKEYKTQGGRSRHAKKCTGSIYCQYCGLKTFNAKFCNSMCAANHQHDEKKTSDDEYIITKNSY